MVMMTPPLAGRPFAPGLRVLVVGGGASGVLLAAQLLRRGRGRVAVTILEKGAMLGCGVAYSTPDPQHLLNTRVANMSAYPDQPEHFLEWLKGCQDQEVDPQGFVSRGTYGRYMQALLDPWEDTAALACWQGECRGLEIRPDGVTALLAGGERVEADLAVLATGHTLPEPEQTPGVSQPWAGPAVPCDGHVLIVGSGLTMVDQVMSLLANGHEGTITAISRRRLLPQVHRPTDPMCFRAEELPQPMRVASLMRWLRAQARAREEAGGDWRDVVDGLRPHLQAIWRALPLASRQSFLRHASPYWEVHRHRMPPASHGRLVEARGNGRLRLLRGRFEAAARGADGRLVARLAGPDGRQRELPVSRIVDCRGIPPGPRDARDAADRRPPGLGRGAARPLARGARRRARLRGAARGRGGQRAALRDGPGLARGLLGDHRHPRHPRAGGAAGRASARQGPRLAAVSRDLAPGAGREAQEGQGRDRRPGPPWPGTSSGDPASPDSWAPRQASLARIATTESATPRSCATCWVMAVRVVEVARCRSVTSAKARVLSAVSWSEREAPVARSRTQSATSGSVGRHRGEARDRGGSQEAVGDHDRPEPEGAQERRGDALHHEVAQEVDQHEPAGRERREAESQLEQEGEQERRGADRRPAQRPRRHGGQTEGRHRQHAQVEERLRLPDAGAATPGRPARAPPPARLRRGAGRRRSRGARGRPGGPGATREQSAKPGPSKGAARPSALIGNEEQEERDRPEPEGKVDEEVPLPSQRLGDPGAEHGSDDRSEERGPGDGGDGGHELGLGRVAQHQEPAHRRHQRGRRALEDPGRHEGPERGREGAGERGQREEAPPSPRARAARPNRSPTQPAAGTSAARARR